MALGLHLWRLLHHVVIARDLVSTLICTSILQETLPVIPKCVLDQPGQRQDPDPQGARCSAQVAQCSQCSKAQSSFDQSACSAAGLTHAVTSLTKEKKKKFYQFCFQNKWTGSWLRLPLRSCFLCRKWKREAAAGLNEPLLVTGLLFSA